MAIDEVLGICMICKKVRIGKDNNSWLNREDDVTMYDNLMEVYKGKLTHTYCPEDFEKKMREMKKLNL